MGTALGPEAGHHQRLQRRLSGFPVYGEHLPAAGPTGRLDGHRQCGRAQRYCALAARRAQLQVRRRGTVSPVFVGEQNRRHLQGNAGCFQFWANQTASDEDFWGQDGNAFAAFLIGETGAASNLNDLHAPRWITHYGAIFGGDTWKIKPNLTVNIGLRWSYDTPRREAAGDTAIWDPTLADQATVGRRIPAGAGRAGLCRQGRGPQRKQERNLGHGLQKGLRAARRLCMGAGPVFGQGGDSRQQRNLLRSAGLCRLRPGNRAGIHGAGKSVHCRPAGRRAARQRLGAHCPPRPISTRINWMAPRPARIMWPRATDGREWWRTGRLKRNIKSTRISLSRWAIWACTPHTCTPCSTS